MAIQQGDFVQVVDRAATPADQKSGLFYNHFRSLYGVVDRVYEDGGLCVVVDHAALSPDMMARLKRSERLIKPRWKTGAPETTAAEAVPTGEDGTEAADTGDGEEAAPAAGDEIRSDESGDLRGTPGLKYAIVLKAEDVRVLGKAGAPRPVIQPPPAAIRASEEEIKAAEQRHISELLRRAER